MARELPEPLATLKRDHDESKRKVGELEERVKSLVNSPLADFPRAYKGARKLFLSIARELSLHIRREEEGLFPIIGGDEDEIGGPPPLVREHYEFEESLDEIHEIMDELGKTQSITEERKALLKGLLVKINLFRGFLLHHIEEEEEVLFPAVLETMSEEDLSRAYGRMKFAEAWFASRDKK